MTFVRRRRTIWLVTLLALLVQTVATQARAAWQCEGKNCGATPWVCCCESPAGEFPGACGVSAPRATSAPRSSGHAGPCNADCGCTFVVDASGSDFSIASQDAIASVFALAHVDSARPDVAPLLPERFTRFLEGRGPPLRAFASGSSSLRAPPAA